MRYYLRKSNFYFLNIAFLFISTSLFSQVFEIRNYNSENGLPQDYIYSVAQDSSGYLWIGTGAGLSRFDGKDIKSFSINDGLAEDFIKVIYTDSHGKVWIGHYEGGISFIEKGIIKKVEKPVGNSSPVNSIITDSEGIIWIGTQSDGVVMIDDGKVVSFKNDSVLATVYSIAEISAHTFLISTEVGVFTFSLKNNELVQSSKTPVFPGTASFILKKNNNREFWVVTKEKLFQYNPFSGNPITPISFPVDFAFDNINSVFQDNSSSLYIGTQGKGVYKIYINNTKAEIREHIGLQNGLNNDYVKSVLVDREYNIWIGTYGGGLNKIEHPQFKAHDFGDNSKINALLQDSEGYLWIARKDALSRVDINGKEGITLSTSITQEIQEISCLEETNTKEILLGTENGGVFIFNKSTKSFDEYFYLPGRPSANKIKDLYKDHSGNIWIATYEGVFIVNHGKIVKELTIADGLLHNVINTVFSDRDKNIWIVSEGAGISQYVNNKLETFKFKGQVNFNINCITEDRRGRLWLGTDGGGVYSFSKGRFSRSINKEEGLISNYCNAIVCDKNNNLWIVHSEGLTKFTPSLKKVVQFKKINGLSVKSIRSNSIVKCNTDNIYFATEGKLVEYTPHLDALAIINPILSIKGIDLFFEKVDWKQYADSVSGESNLPYQLVLKHNQNHLNFRFNAITLRSPEQVLYRFKLEGFDQKWSLPSGQSFATYANLPPGEYTFKVSALSSGVWTDYKSFAFQVLNPYWKTWWFMISILLAVALTVGTIIYFRIRTLQTKQIFLEDQKNVLMAEIRERKIAEGKIIESEKKLKVANEKLVKTNQELNTFIYRSSHDLKGPLMSIMGLTNLGKMETKENLTSEYFSKIAHSATRLDGILKVLSKVTEIKDWQVQINPVNFKILINEALEEFKGKYNTSIVKCEILVEDEFHSDYDLILIILKALIDNSFKYMNPFEEAPYISIHISRLRHGVRIKVEDNGTGINNDVIDRVFDMFFKGTEKSTGFGLGLYVVNNCVDKLNGTHSIQSVEFKGTTTTVFIPDQKNSPKDVY